MAPPDDAARQLASMLASRADHQSVTTDRLAGIADGVADLESPPVTHLVEGERPQFCFESHSRGVGVDDPEATVDPERGGVFLITDLRVFVLLGLADGDSGVSLTYDAVESVDSFEAMGRQRIELRSERTTYHLWIPGSFDYEAVARAVEYVTYRRKRETPDSSEVESAEDSEGPQSVRERLARLGDAKSRGLIDEEEFQHRKEELLADHEEEEEEEEEEELPDE